METSELFKKVRKIEIRTKGLVNQIFSGEYHSVFKGRGMAFSEVREYQFGDDIRTIDWNVSARFNHPFVKVFEEERELTVMLVVDVSGSGEFGTVQQMKKDVAAELCAVLAFSALQNNDKVGVIFFSDIVEKFIPPKKGRTHILRIVREILDFKPAHRQTRVAEGLRYLTSAIKKRSIAFLVSDFLDEGYDDALKIAARKHDLIGIRLYDLREEALPSVGLMRVMDAESGEAMWVDTSDRLVRERYAAWWKERADTRTKLFRRSGVDAIDIRIDQSYISPLMQFFRAREKRW
ncbi:MAG: DUF58 domain-containing protein [Ignavibacteriae bacterium]|nr:DUF58 domain-containing protein [Ignavibacteria bacterium]MBI3364364.1 DUF58 domain-containing protein [Ignavibacteriota bacterium]